MKRQTTAAHSTTGAPKRVTFALSTFACAKDPKHGTYTGLVETCDGHPVVPGCPSPEAKTARIHINPDHNSQIAQYKITTNTPEHDTHLPSVEQHHTAPLYKYTVHVLPRKRPGLSDPQTPDRQRRDVPPTNTTGIRIRHPHDQPCPQTRPINNGKSLAQHRQPPKTLRRQTPSINPPTNRLAATGPQYHPSPSRLAAGSPTRGSMSSIASTANGSQCLLFYH
ncbi:hypothetical protein MHUMG1_08409 [Metarhizium humberi]|uniref:Uncharacterized protein n=1 Tax=Metarhizium humberi TaxID=2596975 RepID=A0A9P8S4V9_9HYPO|nr:hypothetical protein MHUMG1_08409 [Metarhizium humberi]